MLQNVTTATTTVLNVLGEGNGDVKIRITNNQAADQTVSVQFRDGDDNEYSLIRSLVMPAATAIILDDMRYDVTLYSCEVVTTGPTSITIDTIF